MTNLSKIKKLVKGTGFSVSMVDFVGDKHLQLKAYGLTFGNSNDTLKQSRFDELSDSIVELGHEIIESDETTDGRNRQYRYRLFTV